MPEMPSAKRTVTHGRQFTLHSAPLSAVLSAHGVDSS